MWSRAGGTAPDRVARRRTGPGRRTGGRAGGGRLARPEATQPGEAGGGDVLRAASALLGFALSASVSVLARGSAAGVGGLLVARAPLLRLLLTVRRASRRVPLDQVPYGVGQGGVDQPGQGGDPASAPKSRASGSLPPAPRGAAQPGRSVQAAFARCGPRAAAASPARSRPVQRVGSDQRQEGPCPAVGDGVGSRRIAQRVNAEPVDPGLGDTAAPCAGRLDQNDHDLDRARGRRSCRRCRLGDPFPDRASGASRRPPPAPRGGSSACRRRTGRC